MTSPGTKPAVSVVLPVYNGASTIAEAVTSILEQTRRDIEVIVIDDGSSDETLAILRSIVDPRLVIIAEPTHRGLVACLHGGITHATSDVIARMDADDIAHPERLALQHQLFVDDPTVGLAATAFLNVEDRLEPRFVGVPPDHAAAQFALAFSNCISHSSVMFRRSVFDAVGGYDETRFPAEDYDLWLRMIEVTRFASVTSPQMTRRESITGVSAARHQSQQDLARELAAHAIERLTGSRPSVRVLEGLTGLDTPLGCSDFTEASACAHGTYEAVRSTCRTREIPARSLTECLARMLLRSGLRDPNGRWCRGEVAKLVARHPVVCARLASFRLRKIRRERVR